MVISVDKLIMRAYNGMEALAKLVDAPRSAATGIRIAMQRHAALKADLLQGSQLGPLMALIEPVDEVVAVAKKVVR